MSLAPYSTLDIASAVWSGYYGWEFANEFGVLWTPNPAEHPPGPNGWKLLIIIHGGGMRQSGPKYAEPGTTDVPLYFVNNFGVAVLAITYPQGTFEHTEIEHPEAVVWPDHLKPIAHAVQFIKKHASNPAVVGAGGKISTAEIDITGTGLSAGGYLHCATQLQEDGTFEYWPGGRSDDPWFGYEHSHCIGSVRCNGGQLHMSQLSMGTTGDYTWDTYGPFHWIGSYFYSCKFIQAGGTWDTYDMAIKRAAEPIGMLVATNPRVFDCNWYMVAANDALNHGSIRNLADVSNTLSFLHPNHHTRGQIDTDFTSLHAECQEFDFAYTLNALGHTHWRLKAGNSTTNPDNGTAAVRNLDLSNGRFGNWKSAPTRVEVVTGLAYGGATVTVTFFKNHGMAFNVIGVTYVGNVATVQFNRAHQFRVNDAATISGVTSSGTLAANINAAFTVTNVPATDKIDVTMGVTPTGAYTSGGMAVAGQLTLVNVVSTGTLAGLVNGLAQNITAVPAANQLQFVLGSTPTGSYTSGGSGYVLGPGSPEEDYYSFLTDPTNGCAWSLL